MKLKLDENLGESVASFLRQHGHDVATVSGQNMAGAKDQDVIAACHREGRCLVTMDLDFANPLIFKPSQYSGIAVFRLPKNPVFEDIQELSRTLTEGLRRQSIDGKLWIIQRGRIREHQPENEL